MIKFIKELCYVVRNYRDQVSCFDTRIHLTNERIGNLRSDFESYVAYKPIKPASPTKKSLKELNQELKETAPKKRGRPAKK